VVYVEGSKHLGSLGPCPLGIWGCGCLSKHAPPSPMSHHSEFGRSESNITSVRTRRSAEQLDPRVPPSTVTQGHQI